MKFAIGPDQVFFHLNNVLIFKLLKICFHCKDLSELGILKLLLYRGLFTEDAHTPTPITAIVAVRTRNY
jgi:hypothetical protein